MKQIISLLLVFVVGLFSCNKNESDATGFRYTIDGLQNLSVKKGERVNMSFEIKHWRGTQKEVRLLIKGLPNTVSYQFTQESGIPTFQSSVIFTATMHSEPGTYAYSLFGRTPDSDTLMYDLVLTIEEDD